MPFEKMKLPEVGMLMPEAMDLVASEITRAITYMEELVQKVEDRCMAEEKNQVSVRLEPYELGNGECLRYREIKSRFSTHVCDESGQDKMRQIRKMARALAEVIEQLCPDTREKWTALTQLQFAMYSANAAIAMEYPVDEREV